MMSEVTTLRLAQPERLSGVSKVESVPPAVRHANAEPKKSNEVKAHQVVENDIDKFVDELNQIVQNTRRSLQFSVDKGSGEVVVKVVDAETDEVIRQMPSRRGIEAGAAVRRFLSGR